MSTKRSSKSSPSVTIIDKDTLQEAQLIATFDGNKKYESFLDSLSKKGTKRSLVEVSHDAIESVISLKERFPNFREVIDFVTRHMTLSAMSRPSYFRMPPIALGGPAGIGKTQFCKEMAQAIGLESEFVSCSTNNTEFAISGLDRGFSTGYPGAIAEYYRLKDCANPLFIMDEFEKPSKESRSTNNQSVFHGPFFTLLEPNSSNSFEDNYYRVKFDTSFINWIMTVNEFDVLPEPIQSRLTYFEVKPPTKEEKQAICKSIYAIQRERFTCERGLRFRAELEPSVIEKIALNNPREIRKSIENAMAQSVMSAYRPCIGRDELILMEFSIDERFIAEGTCDLVSSEPRGMGFMASL